MNALPTPSIQGERSDMSIDYQFHCTNMEGVYCTCPLCNAKRELAALRKELEEERKGYADFQKLTNEVASDAAERFQAKCKELEAERGKVSRLASKLKGIRIYLIDHLSEVKNEIGGVIGYELHLNAEQVERFFDNDLSKETEEGNQEERIALLETQNAALKNEVTTLNLWKKTLIECRQGDDQRLEIEAAVNRALRGRER